MYKHHQSASLILQFVNGEKAKVTNVSKGTTERKYRNGIWSYTKKILLQRICLTLNLSMEVVRI